MCGPSGAPCGGREKEGRAIYPFALSLSKGRSFLRASQERTMLRQAQHERAERIARRFRAPAIWLAHAPETSPDVGHDRHDRNSARPRVATARLGPHRRYGCALAATAVGHGRDLRGRRADLPPLDRPALRWPGRRLAGRAGGPRRYFGGGVRARGRASPLARGGGAWVALGGSEEGRGGK